MSVERALEDDFEAEEAVEEEHVGRAVLRVDDAADEDVGFVGDEAFVLEDGLLAENRVLELASRRVCFFAVEGEEIAGPVGRQLSVLVEVDGLVAGLLAVDGPVD